MSLSCRYLATASAGQGACTGEIIFLLTNILQLRPNRLSTFVTLLVSTQHLERNC